MILNYKPIFKKVVDCFVRNGLIIAIVGIGLLIRVALMPITTDEDFLSTLNRITLANYFDGFRITHFAELILSWWVLLFKNFFSNLPTILTPDLNPSQSISRYGSAHSGYSDFINSREAFRYLFLMKVPYLLVDILLLWAICRSFLRRNIWVIVFWAVNPFIIFASFMYGRYEIFPVYFAFLALLYARNHKSALAVLLMGVAVVFRISFVIYLPLLLIYLAKNYKEFILLMLISLAPMLVQKFVIPLLGSGGGGGSITGGSFSEFFIRGTIGGEGAVSFSLFMVAFAVIVYYAYQKKINSTLNYNIFVWLMSLLIFSFYAFSYYHPPYVAWIVPVAILLINLEKKILWLSLLAFFAMMFCFDFISIFECRGTAICLLDPFNNSFMQNYYSFNNQIMSEWPGEYIRVFSKSILVICLVYISLLIKKKIDEEKL